MLEAIQDIVLIKVSGQARGYNVFHHFPKNASQWYRVVTFSFIPLFEDGGDTYQPRPESSDFWKSSGREGAISLLRAKIKIFFVSP